MEVINTETLVSSLFAVGFDKVDSILFTHTLGKLSIDTDENGELKYVFNDAPLSDRFKRVTIYSWGDIYALKPGYNMDTLIEDEQHRRIPLRQYLNIDEHLVEVFESFDFDRIVLKKAEMTRAASIGELKPDMFSEKEIGILKRLNFGGKPRVKSLFDDTKKTTKRKKNQSKK